MPPLLVPLSNDVRSFLRPGPRLADELECALSVALGIAFAHWLGARNVSWSAFSGFMVMRGRVGESAVRGILRIVGTIAGAGLAVAAAPALLGRPWLFVVAVGAIGAVFLYGALTAKRAYAWLLAGLTAQMILFDALTHPGFDPQAFARTRLLEVLAGTAACILVSIVSALTVRRLWPAAPGPPARRIGWHPHAVRHAAQAGAAVMLLPPLWYLLHAPEPTQSCVTIMAVMMVPVTSLGGTGFVPVSQRLAQRVAGCMTGALLAAVALMLAHGSVAVLLAATCLGVMLGRHVENGRSPIAYAGTQFVLGVLVVLVPDSYDRVAIGPGFDRLVGILIGMGVLEPVLVAWHLIGRHETITHPRNSAGGGE